MFVCANEAYVAHVRTNGPAPRRLCFVLCRLAGKFLVMGQLSQDAHVFLVTVYAETTISRATVELSHRHFLNSPGISHATVLRTFSKCRWGGTIGSGNKGRSGRRNTVSTTDNISDARSLHHMTAKATLCVQSGDHYTEI